MTNLLALLLAIFAVMGIGHAYAQTSELFVPLPDSELESLDAFEGYNFESQMVTIDTQVFSSEQLSITIFGQSTTFTKDSVEHYEDGNYLWEGSNDNEETAMFEVSGTKAVGIIDTSNRTFQVFPVEATTHEVYLIDQSQFPPDTVVPPGASGEQSFDRDEIDHLVESYIGGFKYVRFTEDLVIDVFIAITTDAISEYGSLERFISNSVIRNTDSTYGYNNIPVELNLVDRVRVSGYTETDDLETDLYKFRFSDEGNLERVRVLIEREEADIAIMFVDSIIDDDVDVDDYAKDLDNKCSLAAQQLVRTPSTAFAVVDIKCLAAYSATNAIGRMHGAGYDIDMERNPIFSHGHGYYDVGIAQRTMMASSGGNCDNPITQTKETCDRRRVWSDPFRNFLGTTNRIGDDVSWNARVVFATAPHIASLRGPAQTYDDTRPTGSVTLPQNIPQSGKLNISATFNEIINPNFPLDVTITNGYTSTTGTMTRTSDTTFEYSHLLDGEDGTFVILFSNARDIFGNPVAKTPTSGGMVTLDAEDILHRPFSGPITTNFEDNFQGGLSQWKLTGYGRPTTATPDEVIFPATDIDTANKVMSSNQCSRICMSTIPTLLDTRQPLTISFDRFVDKSIRQDDGLYLEYSVDDGTTWTTLAEYTSDNDEDTDDWEREYVSLVIPQSSAKLRLLMDVSERRGFVEVDNFKVYKPVPAVPDIMLRPILSMDRTQISFSLMERIPVRLDASDFEISHGTITSLSHRANSSSASMRVADIPYDTPITVTYTGPSILINGVYLNSGTSGMTNSIPKPVVLPEITAPSDMTIEATGALTRLAAEQLGTPTVTGDRLLPATNNAPRDFPLGDTTVRWTVTDASRNSATDTQVITIRDTTPPVIQDVTDLTLETDTDSIAANYAVPVATDTVDTSVDVSCNVAVGADLPIGEHIITCTATDDSENTSQTIFRITVIFPDFVMPVITAPTDITLEATGILTPVNIGTASATDNAGASPVITNNAPNSFPLGTTQVVWTATDAAGNTGSDTQDITIQDTTKPVFGIGVRDISLTSSVSTSVDFATPSATDIFPVSISCDPASGAVFAIGTTQVTCTATDSNGNSAEAVFSIIISHSFFNPVLIDDSFDATLDSWQYKEKPHTVANQQYCHTQNTDVYSLSRSTDHGGSANVQYSVSCWFGAAGGARSFEIPSVYSSGDLSISLDRRSLADLLRFNHVGHINNMHYLISDSQNNVFSTSPIFKGERNSSIGDTGWGSFSMNIPFTESLACPCELYIFTHDSWQAEWKKQLFFDNVTLKVIPSASGAVDTAMDVPSTLKVDELFGMMFSNGTKIVVTNKQVYDNSIAISWDAFDHAQQYKVTIAAADTPAEEFAYNTNKTDHRFIGLEPDTQYEIRVGVTSDVSTQSVLQARTLSDGDAIFESMLSLSVAIEDENAAVLSWTDANNVGGNTYRVERQIDGGFVPTDLQPGANTVASENILDEWHGVTLTYRVYEIVDGQKLYSNEVSVDIPQ